MRLNIEYSDLEMWLEKVQESLPQSEKLTRIEVKRFEAILVRLAEIMENSKSRQSEMTYRDIYERAKSLIGEENINDYRPAVFIGAPDSMCNIEVCVPYAIMIWLKNGDWIWYKAAQQEKDDFNEMIEGRKKMRDAFGY